MAKIHFSKYTLQIILGFLAASSRRGATLVAFGWTHGGAHRMPAVAEFLDHIAATVDEGIVFDNPRDVGAGAILTLATRDRLGLLLLFLLRLVILRLAVSSVWIRIATADVVAILATLLTTTSELATLASIVGGCRAGMELGEPGEEVGGLGSGGAGRQWST